MYDIFTSRNVLTRFLALWTAGFTCMYIAWSISYRALPDGVLCGKFLVNQVQIVTQELLSTFSRILTYNLFLACVPLVLANLVRVKGIPLGYMLASYHWVLYGMLLGTNSFIMPSPSRLLPSIGILFYGIGIYEITAYTLIAAATCSITVYFGGNISDVRIGSLLRSEKITLAISFALLAASNLVEAWQIVN